ncbi:MAG: hypothetical protein OQK81_01860 [Candidatus Bathyarchaeota archaeon]|nr:hypothetical protein [Candidatus Bathyarchaeota archaeon]
MDEIKYCSPKCRLFKCVKRAVIYQRDKIWCKWTDEECNVANCTYASCMRRQLLPNGVCGETVKRKTIDKKPEEIKAPPVRFKSKTLRKLRDDDFY